MSDPPSASAPASASQPHLHSALSITLTALYWIVYPITLIVWTLALFLVAILRLLYQPIAFLLQPVVYFVRFILACVVLPFRVAARFETLYIYLGVAALVGISGGLIVAGIFTLLRRGLGLDTLPAQPPVRTAKEYRQQKQKSAVKVEGLLLNGNHLSLSPGYLSPSDSGKKARSLLAQTIMEEEGDSDF